MTTNINFGALLSVSVVLMLLLYSFGFTGQRNAYAVGFFSKTDKPFGVSYDDWTSRYWNNSLAKNSDQATPKQNGCLLINNNNKSEPMAMLMETADVNFPPTQTCEISSSQGLVIPLWIGWCDTGAHKGASDALLTKCARQQNLGNIISDVKVDGIPVAKLNVRQSVVPGSGALDYKINSLNNVTDLTSKGFALVIPKDTHKANQVPGTWHAVSQGWWVFTKPLTPGHHTVFYNIRVTPTGALTSPGTTPHFADINYDLDVTK